MLDDDIREMLARQMTWEDSWVQCLACREIFAPDGGMCSCMIDRATLRYVAE